MNIYGMNLHLINQQAIEAVTPFASVVLYTYKGSTFSSGDYIPNYNNPVFLQANMQLTDDQTLKLINNYSVTSIYKTLFIYGNVTGLNRNINNGGDYWTWLDSNNNLLRYRVVKVIDNFNTGYSEVVGVEGLTADE